MHVFLRIRRERTSKYLKTIESIETKLPHRILDVLKENDLPTFNIGYSCIEALHRNRQSRLLQLAQGFFHRLIFVVLFFSYCG